MKRKHKLYSRPKRPFEKARIEEEAGIREEYGLKNKIEIWKADSQVRSIREKAKKLISASPEQQKALFERLKKIGFKVSSISDILSLEKKDYLNRRLQTIVFRKKIARSPKQARQMIVHKKILVDNRIIDSPSYLVPIEFEEKISAKKTVNIKKQNE
jgi:small subunit ribosomal protein S4